MKFYRLRSIGAGLLLGIVLLTGCLPQQQEVTLVPQITIAISAAGGEAVNIAPAAGSLTPQADLFGAADGTQTAQQALPKPLLRLEQEQTSTVPLTWTTMPEMQRLPPELWKEWPEIPEVSSHLREIYQLGLSNGNDPHAFSVLGDCQSQPEVFMGLFDSDPAVVRDLPAPLRGTVRQFAGSFNRYSPTVKDATTEGALLWAQWNDNKEKKCNRGETPIDCELRVHKPSIVFIHIGTHWEARNRHYLTLIIDKILAQNAIPVMVTKADNREKDERVNNNLASLAAEYNLPLWNFWATVQHLPENGLKKGSDTYLSDEGIEIHRMGALKALNAVWEAVQ